MTVKAEFMPSSHGVLWAALSNGPPEATHDPAHRRQDDLTGGSAPACETTEPNCGQLPLAADAKRSKDCGARPNVGTDPNAFVGAD